ncbi:hypothetical protein ELH27_29675 (plasmid) [Rhizobium leguminosarum]|jgi:hypothetical protein|uniref:Uncharacterized protein n=1 Tax=Rhizobium beringeri TaxID=3019934 RepID=A0ABY1XJ03_9HYPH|nr:MULTISPECIES: hypothetical protein [Rhizobium]NKL44027.1 hypothetical protein [Rhizobium leguminosarum bv. viciae]MBY5460904.1 hypothetical protein [Rhizobium leguminosarum]TBC60692.1 hypothetical protein ELH27_29675 [Rhizobium leguminosarum]TBE59894.1 hypothetical protein ELH03_29910 [Rhizobium beringeri]WSH30824.1 hypothetical protein U8P75_30945 [Rhizobium beringeri]
MLKITCRGLTALCLPWFEALEAVSMAVPIAARRDFDSEFGAFRLEFLVRAVFEMVVEEQGAILSSEQLRFKIVAQCGKPEELA